VQGTEYELPPASDGQIAESGQIATTYTMQFLPGSSNQHANCEAELTTKLQAFRTQLLRAAAEGRALADAQNFELNEERLSRNIKHLRELESLEELKRGGHHRRQQASGMNSTRIRQWLNADLDIGKFLRICDHGVVADKDLNIRCTERTAPHRNLQRRELNSHRFQQAHLYRRLVRRVSFPFRSRELWLRLHPGLHVPGNKVASAL
jgi:hypothetical protein